MVRPGEKVGRVQGHCRVGMYAVIGICGSPNSPNQRCQLEDLFCSKQIPSPNHIGQRICIREKRRDCVEQLASKEPPSGY